MNDTQKWACMSQTLHASRTIFYPKQKILDERWQGSQVEGCGGYIGLGVASCLQGYASAGLKCVQACVCVCVCVCVGGGGGGGAGLKCLQEVQAYKL